MNGLSNFLVEGFLDNPKKTIALFGGGFKPPTKGHLEVVLQGLQQTPEVNHIKILVGRGVRDGVTQDESVEVWKKYQKFIPIESEIIPVTSPLSFYKDYLREHPEDKVYIFIGAREGDEDDLKDVAQRSEFIKRYSDNVIPTTVSTPAGVSGTLSRKYLNTDPDMFKTTLPSQLSDDEKEEIYQILISTINEGKLKDKLKNFISKLKEVTKREGKETGQLLGLLYKIVVKKHKPSPEEKKFMKGQSLDLGKLAIMGALQLIPGSTAITPLVVGLGKKYGFNVLPSEQSLNEAIDTNFDKIKFYHDYYTNVSPSNFDVNIVENNIQISNITESLPQSFTPEDIRQIPVNQNLEEVLNKIDEMFDDPFGLIHAINEIAGQTFNFTPHIDSLTNYMVDNGMNVEPLPKITYINDDDENANDLMGKTAYYDPNKQEIVLYTLNRHPKDVMRSFAHEMIHHIQNLEDRLGNITTTDTREDDHLTQIEKEAYTDGNLTFRKWTETITEAKNPQYYEFQITITPSNYSGVSFLHKNGRLIKSSTSKDDNPLTFTYKNVPSLVKAAYKLKNNESKITIWDDSGEGNSYPFTSESIKLIKKQAITEANINEMTTQEMRFWAFHSDIFSQLRKFGEEKYKEFIESAKGERRGAVNYFWNLLKKGELSERLASQESIHKFKCDCG